MGQVAVIAALAFGCPQAIAQTRAQAAAQASIVLIQPGGLRAGATPGAAGPIVEASEPAGASYQIVTPPRIVAGGLVIETADVLRGGEGAARLPIGVGIQRPAGPGVAGEVALLPVTAVFE
jgi:hypothetical protein